MIEQRLTYVYFLSATLFCWEVSMHKLIRTIPSFCKKSPKIELKKSLGLSVLKFVFSLELSLHHSVKIFENLSNFRFFLHEKYLSDPSVIIYK